jgi:prepilin-type N-terminal cleavage/methylation domain-containing protein
LKTLKRQAGFTLVELGIVVAIGAILIGIGFMLVPSLLTSSKVKAEANAMSTAATKIQQRYDGRPNFSGITTAIVAGLSVLPENSVSGATVTNSWGGNVTFAANAAGVNNPNDSFLYTTTAVPSAACTELAQTLERSAQVIQVGTSAAPVTVKAAGAPLDVGTLGTQCGATPTVTMVFTFGR